MVRSSAAVQLVLLFLLWPLALEAHAAIYESWSPRLECAGSEAPPSSLSLESSSLFQRSVQGPMPSLFGSWSRAKTESEDPGHGEHTSPLQWFVMAHPLWLVGLSVCLVMGCFVAALAGLTSMLDRYEAGKWRQGEVGRPWYTDDGMQMKVGAGALVIWLTIGMIVFTQLVHFSTSGGEVRCLTAIEAVYLCIQIITTVGYGDLTPSEPAGQVLLASFILFGVVLVGVVFTEGLKVVMRRGERAVVQGLHAKFSKNDEQMQASMDADELSQKKKRGMLPDSMTKCLAEMEDVIAKDLVSDDTKEMSRALLDFGFSMFPFTIFLLGGTVFFVYYPGEDKTVWQAFYMSCVTLTSVGFGAVTPSTQGGKLFAAAWMLVGVGATAHMIICFGNWFLKRHREIQVGHLTGELLSEMDTDGDQSVDKVEFLRFELIRTGLVEKEDVDAILHRFDKLDLDGSGTIDIEDLKRIRGLTDSEAMSSFGHGSRSATGASVTS